MKKIEVLCWGIKHIAENHNFDHYTSFEGEDCDNCCGIFGDNIPTVSDVEMMCDDLGISRDCVDVDSFGICITPSDDWEKDEEYEPTGMEMWKKYDAVIGQ